MHALTRLLFLHALLLTVCAALVACEGDDNPSTAATQVDAAIAEALPGNQVLLFTKDRVYSAYVEGHEATVPVTLQVASLRGKGAKFTSSDSKIAVVKDTVDGAMVTVKREGNVLITGALNGDTGTIGLAITKYSEALWRVGEARYTKDTPALVSLDGGIPLGPVATVSTFGRSPDGACLTCHSQKAITLRIEDTPMQTSGFSDQELITIITMGKRPDSSLKPEPTSGFWGTSHSWNVTDEEKQGLVAYLRTKPPRSMTPGIGVRTCESTRVDGGPSLCDTLGRPALLPDQDAGIDASTPAVSTTGASASATSDAGT